MKSIDNSNLSSSLNQLSIMKKNSDSDVKNFSKDWDVDRKLFTIPKEDSKGRIVLVEDSLQEKR